MCVNGATSPSPPPPKPGQFGPRRHLVATRRPAAFLLGALGGGIRVQLVPWEPPGGLKEHNHPWDGAHGYSRPQCPGLSGKRLYPSQPKSPKLGES